MYIYINISTSAVSTQIISKSNVVSNNYTNFSFQHISAIGNKSSAMMMNKSSSSCSLYQVIILMHGGHLVTQTFK